ncbi:MAG: copper resistance protein CopC [Chloroflexota bacterium]
MMWRRVFIIVGIFVVVLMSAGLASAHAIPVKSDPAPNAILDKAPQTITIWFNEPLEPDFSNIRLRDRDGNLVEMPAPSTVSSSDPTQMTLTPGDLPDGLYTVAWRSVSAADGHPTLGSFAFIVGSAAGGFGSALQQEDTTNATSSAVRWLNLLTLSMTVGGLGFLMFTWSPAIDEAQPAIERRMALLTWIGWILVGVMGIALLLLQYAVVTDALTLTNIDVKVLQPLIADTRFGHLWLARMALWVGMGLSLLFARTDKWFNPIALVLGFGILLTNSLFSHGNGTQDTLAAVGADWLHLTATALWVGGLFQFVNIIGPVRKTFTPSAPVLNRLVGYFTNFARVSVASLIVTGLYSAWLEVGSVEGLLTTFYGQVLLIKILLIIPVIGLAAVNLFYTHRGLAAGNEIWGKRLRGLVGAEIVLTIGILAAVGVLTSSVPARTSLTLSAAAAAQTVQPAPITETVSTNDINAQLTIAPGWVGDNTFTLTLTDSSGKPVTDSTLIRMKFDSQTQNLGESELRPTAQSEGVYTISGSNLSVAGDWRIRITVARPDQYDALFDFKPTMTLQPLPAQPAPIDPSAPLPYRTLALLAAGILALVIGGFFLGENRFRPPRAASILAVGLLLVGGAFLVSGVGAMSGTVSASAAFEPSDDAPIKMAISSEQQNPLPYLITQGGELLQSNADETYTHVPLDAHIRDVYADVNETLWASTDTGFYEHKDGTWTKISDLSSSRTVLTHGYYFALENGGITRVPAGGGNLEKPRQLKVPLPDQPAADLVMLGNHTHIIQNGGQIFQTNDLGLSWKSLDAPLPVGSIETDADGNLLAVSEDGVRTWNYQSENWGPPLWMPGLPSPQNINPLLRIFDGKQYAVIDGQLYIRAPKGWETVPLPGADGAYLTDLKNDVALTDLKFQYPTTLWALDAKGRRLWTTTDGTQWRLIPIQVS